MKALWIEQGRVRLRDDLPEPRPAAGEALLRLKLAGVCATDLELQRGYLAFAGIPGHEFVAEVLEASSAPGLVGARVVGEINAACGSCATCRAGLPRHCPDRTVLGLSGRSGAFAEQFVLPVENLHRVPASVTDRAAVFVEPLAAALEVQEQVAIRPGQRVLVVGAGRLGQLVARTLAMTGCELQVAARHPRQRSLLEAHGIASIEPAEVASRSADLVVEASGAPSGLQTALKALRPRGTLVLKSTFADRVELDLAPLVIDEVTLVGSRCGPFAPALRLLQAGQLDPTDLIDATLPLARGEEALVAAAQPGALKLLLQP